VKLKGFVLLAVTAAAAAALWPAAGGAAGFRGIVVAKERGTLLVTSPAGLVRATVGRATIGSRIVLAGRTAIVVGTARSATIRGIVVRRIGTTLILSSNRHLIAIPNRSVRRLAGTTAAPAPGAVVAATVTIANGRLEEEDEHELGEDDDGVITVSATVKSVAAGMVTLDVQGQTLTVPLPGNLTLPASIVGQTVSIELRLNDDEHESDDDHDGGHHNRGPGGGDDD
jgi:hypothetical protein